MESPRRTRSCEPTQVRAYTELITLLIDRFLDGYAECREGPSAPIGGRLDIMTGANGGADSDARPGLRWDVALSFAGAQRDYVGQVAAELTARGCAASTMLIGRSGCGGRT